jgi:flavodoxin I
VHRIGLFYASCTGNCEIIARKISSAFKPFVVDIYDVMLGNEHKLSEYNYLIFGVPSWDRHLIENDWHDFLLKIADIDFSNKLVAIYGLGDQKMYAFNFLDTMGNVYDWLIEHNANIVGRWPTSGYIFRNSAAVRNGKFVGLGLDEDTEYKLTDPRVKIWVEDLKKEFELIK